MGHAHVIHVDPDRRFFRRRGRSERRWRGTRLLMVLQLRHSKSSGRQRSTCCANAAKLNDRPDPFSFCHLYRNMGCHSVRSTLAAS